MRRNIIEQAPLVPSGNPSPDLPAELRAWQRGLLNSFSALSPTPLTQVGRSGVRWSQLIQACKSQLLNIQGFGQLVVKPSHHYKLN